MYTKACSSSGLTVIHSTMYGKAETTTFLTERVIENDGGVTSRSSINDRSEVSLIFVLGDQKSKSEEPMEFSETGNLKTQITKLLNTPEKNNF